MALRLIEMVLKETDGGEVRELLKDHKVLEHCQFRLPDGEVMVLSAILGVLLRVNPASPEVASRDGVALGDIAVALGSGAAGALAFTTGVSAALIGVLVAVALLPPLVTIGLLLGSGHMASATGALSLFLMNLAGMTTFLLQGIRPATWWEKNRAVKATRIALVLWAVLLAALVGLLLLLRKT